MQGLPPNQKNSAAIASSGIRTMRKDLKRLREADVAKESQRIIEAKPGTQISPETQKQRKFLLEKKLQESKEALAKASDTKKTAALDAEQKKIEEQRVRQEKAVKPLANGESADRWIAERKLENLDKKAQEIGQEKAAQEQAKRELEKKAGQIKEALKTISVPKEPATPPAAAKSEEEQRRKFLEDIEAWARANNNKPHE